MSPSMNPNCAVIALAKRVRQNNTMSGLSYLRQLLPWSLEPWAPLEEAQLPSYVSLPGLL